MAETSNQGGVPEQPKEVTVESKSIAPAGPSLQKYKKLQLSALSNKWGDSENYKKHH